MRRKKRLSDIEKERGIVLEVVIPALVNEGGQKRAADELGVSQFSICEWLQRNRYVRIVRYEKDQEQAS